MVTAASLRASNVVFLGSVSYQVSGTSVTLTVNEVDNQSASGTSGTLRLELWALPSAYSGSSQTGYQLATYSLGTLQANYHFSSFSRTVAYTPPANGTWHVALEVTEYTGASSVDGGYLVDDFVNFSNTLQQGPVTTPPPPPPPTARLINLSVRSTAGTGSQTLIGGFVIGGTGSKSVLARGDGPALSGFGVSGVLPDPALTLFKSGSTSIASNSGWGGTSNLSSIFSQVGAFALSPSSKDAALLQTLNAGAYTANITSTSGDSGVVLVEVYDADSGTPSSRFINLSARSEAGTGSQTLIAGFVIGGSGTETVLIRADGPALSQFGVTGVLAAPQLTLFDSGGSPIATNTGWSSPSTRGSSTVQASISAATSSLFSQVGAFPLPTGSADSAVVATLPAGAYSALVTGVGNTTGVALAEIYEVPGFSTGGSSAPVFTSQPSGGSFSSGGSLTLTVTVSGSATFQWYLDGVAIPGATGSSYMATAAGTYTVVATNSSGSARSSAVSVTRTTTGGGGGGGGISGTWILTWNEQYAGSSPSSGWCDYEDWDMQWGLTQSGNNVSGTYVMTVHDLAPGYVLCPDVVGTQYSGSISGTVSGSSFTLITDGGTVFSGTVSGATMTGLGSSLSPNAVLGESSTGTFKTK